jgi:cholesterol oxidase
MTEHFDAVVVGSGFGGSVSTYRLAVAGKRVCLLERGKRYAPGDFPRGVAGMAGNFWDPSRGGLGLFNFWSFRHLEAIVSSGLGGGSLIYANVIYRMHPEWFDGWPIGRADLDPHYDAVHKMLKPTAFPYPAVRKTVHLTTAAAALHREAVLPDLAVTFASGGRTGTALPIDEPVPNLHGANNRFTCRLCGECDIGCNDGSKNSLDLTYLSAAQATGRADLRTLCEVVEIRPGDGGGYRIAYVEQDPELPVPVKDLPLQYVTADQLILAAGSLGTTFLLLKNQDRFPGLNSAALGTRFCGNGDLLGFVNRSTETVGGRKRIRRLDPHRGPVITTAILFDDPEEGRDFLIEDGGIPEFVLWLMEARNMPGAVRRLVRTAGRRLAHLLTGNPRSDFGAELRTLLGDGALSSGSLPLLGMGRDTPDGVMRLRSGYLDIKWSTKSSRRYFERVRREMRAIATQLEGDFADNPAWHLGRRVITAHPLGGCPMDNAEGAGVVDSFGEVHGHPGMWIVDGSVMPGPVAANPAFTIAAFADRAADVFTQRR